MRNIATRVGLAAAATLLLVGASLLATDRDVAAQDGSPYTLRGFSIAADGDPATAPPPGCTFVGIWRGDYFSSQGVSFWRDHHADGSGFEWVADFSGAAPGEEIEIVLVQRIDETTDRVGLGRGDGRFGHTAHLYPESEDLEVGFDVYLCRRPTLAAPPPPLVIVTSTDPLAFQVVPQAGTAWTGNLIFVSAPGISEVAPASGTVSMEAPITGPITLQTGVSVPIVPVVSPQFFGGSPPPGHVFEALTVTPTTNDRTAFVWSVTPNETLWRPVFRLAISGGGTFDFPGPRIFNAFDSQIITLNLPNNLVPAGTGTDDIQLSIPSSGPLNQAPTESHLFQRGATIRFDGGAGNDVLTIESTLYNPLETNVTLTNDSIGVALTNCETGVPYFTGRSTLNTTIPGGSNSLVSYNLHDRITIGPELPELPDPDSPTFTDDMFAWIDEVCVVMESHPALTPQ